MTWKLEAFDPDVTVVTVNNRLAKALRARHDQLQVMRGARVWQSADMLPWNAWLQRCYQYLLDTGATQLDLLTPAQEQLLWREIIEHPRQRIALLRPAAAAADAQAAHQLCQDWLLTAERLRGYGDDTQHFLAWQRRFERRLAEHGLLSPAGLIAELRSAIEAGTLPIPGRLIYAGFETLSPAQSALFDALRAGGCRVQADTDEPVEATRRCVAQIDSERETRLAAVWARTLLERDPTLRIAIVSPRIGRQRRQLERVFRETLSPAAYLHNAAAPATFNISLGEPLAERPMIADALLALRAVHGELPLSAIGRLLRSPFIGAAVHEWEARALLDALLREDGIPTLTLGRLQRRLERLDPLDPRYCDDLTTRLSRLTEAHERLPASDAPANWAGHLRELLAILGWPGEQGLDSQEFQQHERMQRLFSEFATLGKVRPRMGYGDAVQQLAVMAGATVFQPETPAAPVQLLGPLEAAGLRFDAIWLLDMADQYWPPSPQPNPLLPSRLQRELGMPQASAARELAFAQSITARLGSGAPRVVASFALTDGEREQGASPLIADWPMATPEQLVAAAAPVLHDACTGGSGCTPLPAARASSGPEEPRGGAALLGAQANCPFQAVARFRLRARPLAEPSHAADAALIGNLVHELLQRVWSRLHDSQQLAGCDGGALRTLIASLSVATLDDIGRRRPDLFTARFKEIEAQRLTQLIVDWLQVERRRAQPFEVVALEQDRDIELHGLRLRTRADRVDRLADGSLAVIDYKTGRQVRTDGWFDDRLTEPQLPLYCVSGAGDVGAALLARLHPDRPGQGFVGISRSADFAPGVASTQDSEHGPSWDAVLTHWRRSLHDLAAEIAAGRADPTPSIPACRYCPYDALCRVGELDEDDADG